MLITAQDVLERAQIVLRHVISFPDPDSLACAFACLPADGAKDFSEEALREVARAAIENVTEVVRERVPVSLVDVGELAERVKAGRVRFIPACGVGGEFSELLKRGLERGRGIGEDEHMGEGEEEEVGEEAAKARLEAARRLSTQVTDDVSGVTMMRLSNGAKVTFKQTPFEKSQCNVCVHASGGIALETCDLPGAVQLGVSAMTDSGCGEFSADSIERFCSRWGVTLTDACSSEGIYLWFSFSSSDTVKVERAFEIIHTVLAAPRFEPKAIERAKRDVRLSHVDRVRSLERTVQDECFLHLFEGPDARMHDLRPSDVDRLNEGTVTRAVMEQMCPSNLEIIIVGDFDEDFVKRCLLLYVGTIPRSSLGAETISQRAVAQGHFQLMVAEGIRKLEATVLEDASRACVFWAFPTINRYPDWASLILLYCTRAALE